MVWGKQSNGIQDILDKVKGNRVDTIYILPIRKFGSKEAVQLADALRANTSVETLYASGHNIGTEGVQAFAEMLQSNTSLKHLCIGSPESMGDEGARILCQGVANNTSLRILDMENKNLTSASANAIADILRTSHLEEILLGKNNLNDDALETITSAMAENKHVRKLGLSANEFTGKSNGVLAQMVLHSNLIDLDISSNNLSTESTLLAKAISGKSTLKNVSLLGCQVGDDFANALVYQGSTIEELDLSQNNISSAGACTIAQGFLSKDNSLQKLRLGENQIDDEGAGAMSQVLLEQNTTLIFLDLGKNSITSTGCVALLGATNLRELRLFQNRLADGVADVCAGIENNRALRVLDLGANELHGPLAAMLFKSLQRNSTLETLEMGGNNIESEGQQALEELRDVRPTLDIAIDKRDNSQNSVN